MANINSGEMLLIFVVLLLHLPTLRALVDILKSEFHEPVNKLVWVVVVLMLPIIGPLLYFLISQPQKRTSTR
jgi:hypothetical protein